MVRRIQQITCPNIHTNQISTLQNTQTVLIVFIILTISLCYNLRIIIELKRTAVKSFLVEHTFAICAISFKSCVTFTYVWSWFVCTFSIRVTTIFTQATFIYVCRTKRNFKRLDICLTWLFVLLQYSVCLLPFKICLKRNNKFQTSPHWSISSFYSYWNKFDLSQMSI